MQPDVLRSSTPLANPSPVTPPPPLGVAERPNRPCYVQLLGEIQDNGFERPQWLVQRGDHYVQITELLYRILEVADGESTCEEIAASVAASSGRPVNADNVRTLIAARLIPLGLIELPVADTEAETTPTPASETAADHPPTEVSSDETSARASSMTASMTGNSSPSSAYDARATATAARFSPMVMTLRFGFIGPEAIEAVTSRLTFLFRPQICAPIIALALVAQFWLLFVHGIGPIVNLVFMHPIVLLGVYLCLVLAGISHEFGHATALRYGGGHARGIGFGIYFQFPAFYTDCTDVYRQNRWGRMRTDLGGIYFDILLSLGLFALYALTHQELLLAAVLLLDLEIADQFDPIMRFDGYWALADLIAVPDFFVLVRPILRGMLPARWRPPGASSAPPLKGWVRVFFLGYVVVVIPLLAGLFLLLIVAAPTLIGMSIAGAAGQVFDLVAAWQAGSPLDVGLAVAQALLLLGSAALLGYGVFMLLRLAVVQVLQLRARSPRWRIAATTGGVALAVVLCIVWVLQVKALVTPPTLPLFPPPAPLHHHPAPY